MRKLKFLKKRNHAGDSSLQEKLVEKYFDDSFYREAMAAIRNSD